VQSAVVAANEPVADADCAFDTTEVNTKVAIVKEIFNLLFTVITHFCMAGSGFLRTMFYRFFPSIAKWRDN